MMPFPSPTLEMLEEMEKAKKLVIPEHLKDSLIGPLIEGTSFYSCLEGDPTEAGYYLTEEGDKIYKTYHQPTGSSTMYRKVNSLFYGVCWEISSERG